MNTRPETFEGLIPIARLRTADECLFHWNAVIKVATDEWAMGFAKSIKGQSRRRGWLPTPKQLNLMRSMVSALFADRDGADDDPSLIE